MFYTVNVGLELEEVNVVEKAEIKTKEVSTAKEDVVKKEKKVKKPKSNKSNTELLEMKNKIEAEKKRLLEEKDMAEEEKKKLADTLAQHETELVTAQAEQDAIKQKLVALEKKIIVGGENLLEKAEEQERMLEESAKGNWFLHKWQNCQRLSNGYPNFNLYYYY